MHPLYIIRFVLAQTLTSLSQAGKLKSKLFFLGMICLFLISDDNKTAIIAAAAAGVVLLALLIAAIIYKNKRK